MKKIILPFVGVVAVIAVWIPATGSVDLGYGCSPKKLSWEQVKTKLSVPIAIVLDVVSEWEPISRTRSPVCEI